MKFFVVLLLTVFLHTYLVVNVLAQESIDLNVPLIGQERNLSCESAAIRMVLAYKGQWIPEQEIFNKFIKHPNPDIGFRGNVDGKLFTFTDYGVHAAPVASVINQYGVSAKAYYGINQDLIKQKALEGKPSIIWISGQSKVQNLEIEGQKTKLVLGEHTVVVNGFKDNKFILNDPWKKSIEKGVRVPTTRAVANLDSLNWHLFNRMAVILD